jgi:anti-anti-sigma factor
MSAGLPTGRPLLCIFGFMSSDADAPKIHHIALSGEYDIARKHELASAFASVDGAPVIIDMSEVTYVDSSFLSELMGMRLRLEDRPVTLIGVRPGIARIFAIASLDRFFVFR